MSGVLKLKARDVNSRKPPEEAMDKKIAKVVQQELKAALGDIKSFLEKKPTDKVVAEKMSHVVSPVTWDFKVVRNERGFVDRIIARPLLEKIN